MSEDEIDRFLCSLSTAIVVAGPAGAAPLGAVGDFHYDTGTVAFSLHPADPIVGQLGDGDRVCCIAEQFPSYFEIKSVMLHGYATRRRDSDLGAPTFDLDVDKVVSFDFGKLTSNPARA